MLKDLGNKLAGYLAGQLTLEELELWLVGQIHAISVSDDQESREIVDELDALLIEYGEKVISRLELDDAIAGFIRRIDTVRISFPPKLIPRYVSEAVATAIRTHFEDLGPATIHRVRWDPVPV